MTCAAPGLLPQQSTTLEIYMSKTVFERFHETEVSGSEGGVLITQRHESSGDFDAIFIPGRYVEMFIDAVRKAVEG